MLIRLVLADEHPIVLDALENLFRAEPDFKVLARCRDGEEALRAVLSCRPDVLILDIRLPGKDGLAVLREMKKAKVSTRVVLFTAALDETEALDAIRLGVNGVVLKEMAPELLVKCVRKVHGGGQWLETRSVSRALEKLVRRQAEGQQITDVLTLREIEIVRLVAGGLRNKEVAEKLAISEGTVKVHLHNIYQKLHVKGRLELALYAQDRVAELTS